MTKKEFKEAMLRGLGRCVRAVQQEPEKYRDIVLWACKRNIGFDTQCEGSRSWYVYTMVKAYPNQDPFIRAAIEALKKYHPNGGWDLTHLGELLMYFATDGHEAARIALEEKYQEILSAIHSLKRRPNRLFCERWDLERLGLMLAIDKDSFLKIAADFGRLYREKKFISDGSFEWFFDTKGGRFKKTMERAAQSNEDIRLYMQKELATIAALDEYRKQRAATAPGEMKGIRLSGWLKNAADPDTVESYALAYRQQTQPEQRAMALKAFVLCPYPDDPTPIIEDTHSPCEDLQDTAWSALENIRHPVVRQFALDNIGQGVRTLENFALLVSNYIPPDGRLLEELLREMIITKDLHGVHGAGMNIFRAFYKGSNIPHPKHLLPLLYEYTPCSCCRRSTLEYMSKHRMLSQEVLEECLFDSDEDIRLFAKRRLRKS